MEKIELTNDKSLGLFITESNQLNNLKIGETYTFLCKCCGKKVTTKRDGHTKTKLLQNRLLCKSCGIKQTCIEKYGVLNPSQIDGMQEKIKQNNLEKYGVTSTTKLESVKQKIAETNLNKYGVKSVLSLEDIRFKIRKTNMEHYGVENPFQSEEIKEKIKNTLITKYGVDHPSKSEEIQYKKIQTNLLNWGVENVFKSDEIKSKIKETNLRKFGTEHPSTCKYSFDNIMFDSSWELIFYVFQKEHNNNISRVDEPIMFEFNGKVHSYFPDFIVNGVLYEVKGDQFFDADNNLICPFDESKNELYKAKQLCAVSNGVMFIRGQDVFPMKDYVLSKYGKDFIEKCKVHN